MQLGGTEIRDLGILCFANGIYKKSSETRNIYNI